jgi:hypothetical protein
MEMKKQADTLNEVELQRFAEVLTDKRKWREETKTQRGRAVERSGRALQRRDGT